MKIYSIKNGFTADHSSTSYEFLAVDKPLGKKEKSAVASLSSRADPTSRRVSFVYHVDGYDIPGGWEKLMEKYYDVMYTESYDWWTIALAFNTSSEQIAEMEKYDFVGEEDSGVGISSSGNRVTVIINCRVNPECLDKDYEDSYENYDEEDEYEDNADEIMEDEFLSQLVKVREQLINGDYRVLYALWDMFKYDDEEEEDDFTPPPVPQEKSTGKDIVDKFINCMDEF